MARQLWLLRHADAEPHGERPDPERPLTERGRRQARIAGTAFVSMGVSFERVLVSSKVRADQTAAIALQQWPEAERPQLEPHGPLAGGFDGACARDALAGASQDARILLVGHEPDLSEVARELAGARLDLKKGGLVVVRVDGTIGELILLLRPRELALIAGQRDADV
jgi:phosphohistidine phosphatase